MLVTAYFTKNINPTFLSHDTFIILAIRLTDGQTDRMYHKMLRLPYQHDMDTLDHCILCTIENSPRPLCGRSQCVIVRREVSDACFCDKNVVIDTIELIGQEHQSFHLVTQALTKN